jgi:hypothetical protein
MALNLVLAAALTAASLEPQAASAAGIPVASASTSQTASQSSDIPTAQPAADPQAPASASAPKLVLPKGTMVRLMVLKEVNSRDNKPGDRFVLRVDEAVQIHGVTVIPIGAKGWGELVGAERTGEVGKSGRINARLLYVEANGQRVDLEGERQSSGGGGTGQVVASVLAFGPFGLLMKGNNASLKAGEILNGYTLADTAFDPDAGTP